MESVAAIILNYNATSDCINCIEWLKKQEDICLTIILVDNCSSDGLEELKKIANWNMNIQLIENRENRGFSAGNNIGLKRAADLSYRYALIINPDMEIRNKFYIRDAVKCLKEHSDVVVLGTDIVNMQNQHQNPTRELRFFEEFLWPIEIVKQKFTKKLPYTCDSTKSGFCYKITGCCFFVDLEFMKEINYLDENVFLYCEEPILAAAVARAGKKEYYYSELVAYHMHKESTKGDPKKRMNQFFKSRIYYLKSYSSYRAIPLKMILVSRNIQKWIFGSKE